MPKFKDKKDEEISAKDIERGLERKTKKTDVPERMRSKKEKWWTVSDVADKTWTENWQWI